MEKHLTVLKASPRWRLAVLSLADLVVLRAPGLLVALRAPIDAIMWSEPQSLGGSLDGLGGVEAQQNPHPYCISLTIASEPQTLCIFRAQ
jgi:hypothetical protein